MWSQTEWEKRQCEEIGTTKDVMMISTFTEKLGNPLEGSGRKSAENNIIDTKKW